MEINIMKSLRVGRSCQTNHIYIPMHNLRSDIRIIPTTTTSISRKVTITTSTRTVRSRGNLTRIKNNFEGIQCRPLMCQCHLEFFNMILRKHLGLPEQTLTAAAVAIISDMKNSSSTRTTIKRRRQTNFSEMNRLHSSNKDLVKREKAKYLISLSCNVISSIFFNCKLFFVGRNTPSATP